MRLRVPRPAFAVPLLVPLLVCLLVAALHAPGRAEEAGARATPQAQLAGLTWLAGAWSGSMWGGTFETYYSTPEGGRVLSYSQLLKSGKPAFHEFEVFGCEGDELVLRPHPRGRPAAAFTLQTLDPTQRKATFENPKNDFPTRIEYHRATDERLVITLSDPHGTSGKTEVFDLARVR